MRWFWFKESTREWQQADLKDFDDDELVKMIRELDIVKSEARQRMKEINREQTRRMRENPPDPGMKINLGA